MNYSLTPLIPDDVQEVIAWTYDPPYDFYNFSQDTASSLLLPEYRYHAVLDKTGDLIGYCCFGLDGQVPGGDYSQGEPDILDFGVGLRPDLTSRGLGRGFVRAIIDYAVNTYHPKTLRVTVAAFNQRSLKVFRSLGFYDTHQFTRELIDIPFIQLEKIIVKDQ
jgi:RimJ/RimL family protein N-acetyltransferase